MKKNEIPVPLEHDEQVMFVKWFHAQYPSTLIYATPNGGKRGKREALSLKNEGVVAGIPDLFIPEWRLFIEMKRQRGGVVSADQKKVMAQLQSIGYDCVVCKGAKAAIDEIRLRHDNTRTHESSIKSSKGGYV